MLKELFILKHHGSQYIPDLRKASVPVPFRGKPEISNELVDSDLLVSICPTGAITKSPIAIDLGRCLFCGECSFQFPQKITFSSDHRLATNDPHNMIISEGETKPVEVDPDRIRQEIRSLFSRSLKLRQISAGGDNSAELELGACGNANFDMGRFGIEFVASPRHADGILITGPITRNMTEAVRLCYEAVPEPKLVILAGTDAISGGIFADSPAIDRSILSEFDIDLFIPGNPPHPLTIINGILDLTRKFSKLE